MEKANKLTIVRYALNNQGSQKKPMYSPGINDDRINTEMLT